MTGTSYKKVDGGPTTGIVAVDSATYGLHHSLLDTGAGYPAEPDPGRVGRQLR